MTEFEEKEYDAVLGLTSQMAVEAIGNRYDLVLVASRRIRELNRGDAKKLACRRGNTLTALKEIEFGKVDINYLYKEQNLEQKRYHKK